MQNSAWNVDHNYKIKKVDICQLFCWNKNKKYDIIKVLKDAISPYEKPTNRKYRESNS